MINLLHLVKEAIRAVPAVRFALGVAGVIAAFSLVIAFVGSPKAALFAFGLMLGLMTLLLLFALVARTAGAYLHRPALFLVWSVTLLFVVSSALTVTSVFFDWPKPFEDLVTFVAESLLPGPPLELAPDPEAEARLALLQARGLMVSGDSDRAKRHLEAAIEAARYNPAAQEQLLVELGTLSLRNRDIPGAYDALERAVSLSPENQEAHKLVAALYLQRGDLAAAEHSLRTALHLEPSDAEAHLDLGKALLAQKNLSEAASSFNSAIAYAPGSTEAYIGLARALREQGKVEEADAVLSQLESLRARVKP